MRILQPLATGVAAALVLVTLTGCGRQTNNTPGGQARYPLMDEAPPEGFADFVSGPDDAPVKVVAYYPGGHEETLAAVKELLTQFSGKIQVEIVDWRHETGLNRREDAGLICAGVTINGKFTFDIPTEDGVEKVMFVRRMGGEWTKEDLVAAVTATLKTAAAD